VPQITYLISVRRNIAQFYILAKDSSIGFAEKQGRIALYIEWVQDMKAILSSPTEEEEELRIAAQQATSKAQKAALSHDWAEMTLLRQTVLEELTVSYNVALQLKRDI
jgi:hypothetical protein